MKLFQIDPTTKEAVLTAEARTLEPFKSIIRRLRKMEGDHDGRKKLLNEKEISFSYWSANYDSSLKYADEAERLKLLKLRLKLPDDWEPDDLVKDAINFIHESQKTPSRPIYESALNAGKAIQAWYDHISANIIANPNQYKADFMIDFQSGFSKLKGTLEQIRIAGEQVHSENESKQTKAGRMIGKFELEDI